VILAEKRVSAPNGRNGARGLGLREEGKACGKRLGGDVDEMRKGAGRGTKRKINGDTDGPGGPKKTERGGSQVPSVVGTADCRPYSSRIRYLCVSPYLCRAGRKIGGVGLGEEVAELQISR